MFGDIKRLDFHGNKMKVWGEGDDCDAEDASDTVDVECAVPLIKEDSTWIVHTENVRNVTDCSRRGAAMVMTITALVLCVYFFFACPKCLFGVLLASACMCPWFNTMNAPLWLAIILLIVSGWTFTFGNLSVTWDSGLN